MSKGEDRMMLKRAAEKPLPEKAGAYDPIFHSEDIAAAEARGAALAIEQCRRLAKEQAAEHKANAARWADGQPEDRDLAIGERIRAGVLLGFAASLPATPDLAAEVWRIEERERLRIARGIQEFANAHATTCVDRQLRETLADVAARVRTNTIEGGAE